MQNNRLRTAIRATAAVAVMGVAGQVGAVTFDAGGYETSVYGYARLNATYDIDENIATSRGTRSANYGSINTGAAEDNEVTGHFGADAVQSRLGFKVMTPEGVKVNLEGDFRGASGSSNGNIRIRHAYGEYNGVLLGRTWSNYTSFTANTSQLDFDGVPGAAGLQGRVSQARYTTGGLSVSLEQPLASLGTNGTESVKDSMPAATVKFEGGADGFKFGAGALVRQVGYDTGTTDDAAVGVAAFLGAKLSVTDTISIQGSANYSDGANAYLYRSGNNFAAIDAYVDANGDVETVSGIGASVGASFDLGGGRSVNAVYGMTDVDLEDAFNAGVAAATDNETNTMMAVNYQWTPVKNVMMGVQYAYHQVDDVNGDDGDASRVHFAAQYNF
ncbi:DcaP family trimeric outer membrane transporter [Marinobacter caseinilyticus]|uniref:DcaP family trimeric outer membrane transporter n=1 Tax=Marinobacter caseinilyticus TaxID=2692195 RepID=UPI00140849EB|nr:DcaP family trimeric outer membrane transporter [Marinobacter caseinilyticus]